MKLRQQITTLVVLIIVVLALSFMTAIGLQIKRTAVLAAVTKAQSDLATSMAVLDLKYPGPWKTEDGFLYKGNIKINNNFQIVDYINTLTGDSCTIFLDKMRVATTIKKENGDRAVGTYVSEDVAKKVLLEGKEYIGEAKVLGEKHQTAYSPIYNEKGNIVGMFYIGISKKFYDNLFYDTLMSMAIIATVLTVVIFLLTIYFTQRVIINPLKLLTFETQKVASGDLSEPIEIESKNEIGELAQSFNEMVHWVQALTYHVSKATGTNLPQELNKIPNTEFDINSITLPENIILKPQIKETWGELPKGLNEVTLQQIINFLHEKGGFLSVSEIAEFVKLTKVTIRRYLDFLEKCGVVTVDLQYGPIGRPLKLYKLN